MDDKVPIRKAPGYERDTSTGVIINTNTADYELILERRKHKREMTDLRSEFEQLKEMVKKLADD